MILKNKTVMELELMKQQFQHRINEIDYELKLRSIGSYKNPLKSYKSKIFNHG